MIFLKLFLLLVLGIILLFLFIPIKYGIVGNYYDKKYMKITTSFIFGLIVVTAILNEEARNGEFKILGFKKAINLNKDGGRNERRGSFLKKIKNSNIKSFINIYELKDLIIAFKTIWKNIKPCRIIIKSRIGFEDPMYTGIFFALINQTVYMPKEFEIKLIPIFNESIIEGSIDIKGKIWIIGILTAVIQLLVKKHKK
jgi:hypothetical protein